MLSILVPSCNLNASAFEISLLKISGSRISTINTKPLRKMVNHRKRHILLGSAIKQIFLHSNYEEIKDKME